MFKKTLGTLLGVGLMFNAATAQEVGDKMPLFDIKKYENKVIQGMDSSNRLRGPIIIIDRDLDGLVDGGHVYDACEGVVNFGLPFFVYDLKNKLIFIDNDPEKSRNGRATDGYIDRVLEYTHKIGEENFYKYAPECVKGKTKA